MVVFPDSSTERLPQSQTSLFNDINTSLERDKGKFQIPCVVVSDDELEKPRHLVILNENNIQIDQQPTTKTDNNDIENEVNVVKKIAAGLRSPPVREKSGPGGGGGSLSSGSSIITIASDPDPELPDPLGPGPNKNPKTDPRTEHWYHTTLQVSVPFFIAGIGTIGAGLVLAEVSQWQVFREITQLFILVPSLLGLKGNLDMCLAARLCTQANLGNMHNLREIVKMIVGNIALVQIQAIIAAVIVSVFAMVVGCITNETQTFTWDRGLLLATSSICTATSSCFILDFVMIAVIMVSYRCKMNPDNLATPLAASVGDVVSISVLSTVASAFYEKLKCHESWILYLVVGCYFLLLPFWIWIVLKNKYTRNVLTSGWVPVLSALFISGFGGLILDAVVNKYKGFVVFQPIINGIGGNLVSVQASRISTMLHQTSLMGILPPHSKMWVPPWKALFKGVPYAKTARILIGMAIPGHLLFIFIADYIRSKQSTLHIYFIASYLTVAVVQVMLLLYVAHIIIHAMWRYKIDPDNSAIPYLTSLGDLTGSLFLALAFWFLYSIHKPYENDRA